MLQQGTKKNANDLYKAICDYNKNLKIYFLFLSNADCAELTLSMHHLL